MKPDFEQIIDSKKAQDLQERIQRLKYDLVSDYRRKQNTETLLMFIMDV